MSQNMHHDPHRPDAPIAGSGHSPQRPKRSVWLVLLAGAAALAVVTVYNLADRAVTVSALAVTAEEEATPSVTLVSPRPGPADREVTLPGDVHAWFQAPIFGQVSGYVKMWSKDIGDAVKRGETLATVDTPGLDQQLEQAKAQLEVAQANYQLAAVTARRWQKLSGTQAVAQQDVDVRQADAQAQKAQVDAAKYNVARYEALEAFKTIQAPFDGVVTARHTDVGDYVTAGGGDAGAQGRSQELFSVADMHKMRVFVSVPQDYSAYLTQGVQATLTFPQYPGRVFTTHDLTTSHAVDPTSRTVLTQLVVDNPDGEILPGAYVSVHFRLPTNPEILQIPEQSLLFRAQGLQVALVGADGRVHLRKVTLGLNLGNTVQVKTGLKRGDRIVANPSLGLMEGEAVRVVDVPARNANDDAAVAAKRERQEAPHSEQPVGQ